MTVTVTTPVGTSATSTADQCTYQTGHLVGWGTDGEGQLDNGSTTVSSSPAQVAALGLLVQVSSKATTTLALIPAGSRPHRTGME